jgi:Flp pilus assembly protein TadG
MNTPPIARRAGGRKPRKGAILVLSAVGMIILLLAAAFSVDIAYMQLTREELHIATDAAAKAAVSKLSLGGTQSQAKQAAIDCAAANTVAGRPLTIDASSVTLGKVAYAQSGHWDFTANGTPNTAAKVDVTMSSATVSGPVSLYFGRMLGTSQFNPRSSSTAAFVRNKVCLTLDRSHSMCFDLSGVEWRYPSGIPARPEAYKYPPQVPDSRWSKLSTAIDIFLTVVAAVPVETRVGLVTWASNVDTGDYWSAYTTYVNGKKVTKPASPASPATCIDQTFTTDFSLIRAPIAARGANVVLGGTNMSAGMTTAINLFASTDDGLPWNKVMILFSDGQWNEGANPITTAATAKANNIVIHTVGLLNNGDSTLQTIAANTGGRYFYAPNETALNAAFQEIARMLPVILTK